MIRRLDAARLSQFYLPDRRGEGNRIGGIPVPTNRWQRQALMERILAMHPGVRPMGRWRWVWLAIFSLIVLPAAAPAEMWLCPLPTGGAIYTNNSKDYQNCAAFLPKS